ncbi:response regulator [Brachybacterium paraconglomeratum]|uniref:response regulator n=1 Tax=Brachybacterium paraconglomeratum TaxID=173362 RepID=UPI0037CAACC6
MTTILLVDDQPMIRAGLRSVLESADFTIIADAADGGEAIALARRHRPDVILMDLRMPMMDGVTAVGHLRADPAMADCRILVLTTFDGDEDVVRAIAAGADGFLSKAADPDELFDAVERTARGEASLSLRAAKALVTHLAEKGLPSPADKELRERAESLTPRERDIVSRVALGDDNATIAGVLSLSPHTVKTHVNRAMSKVHARDRGQLVAFAYRSGIAARGDRPDRPRG